jgi:MoxR-like ATPase
VAFDDVVAVAASALRHRIFLQFEAEADDVTTDQLISEIVEKTDRAKAAG